MTFATPVMRQSGLLHSASAQAFDTVTSPVPDHAASFPGTKYSEPRNWAPGKGVESLPPPKFALSMPPDAPSNMQLVHHSPNQSTSTVDNDPFFVQSPPVHSPPDQAPYPTLGVVGHHRSPQLTFLTSGPGGLPFYSVAMNPAHFPFVDSARQHKPVNHGVVKIRNVR